MREFLATLRRRPAPLIGTFVALTLAALLVTVTAIFLGTARTLSAPAQRLAGATVVVTGNLDVRVTSGTGDNVETDVLSLPDYRRVPLGLASHLASVDGVAAAVPDVSVPVALERAGGNVATGTAAEPLQAHGWDSAALTPFRLASGHAPVTASQLVLGSGVAASTGLRIGHQAGGGQGLDDAPDPGPRSGLLSLSTASAVTTLQLPFSLQMFQLPQRAARPLMPTLTPPAYFYASCGRTRVRVRGPQTSTTMTATRAVTKPVIRGS